MKVTIRENSEYKYPAVTLHREGETEPFAVMGNQPINEALASAGQIMERYDSRGLDEMCIPSALDAMGARREA